MVRAVQTAIFHVFLSNTVRIISENKVSLENVGFRLALEPTFSGKIIFKVWDGYEKNN